jgi:hypothetical protein
MKLYLSIYKDCGQIPDVENGKVDLDDPSNTFLDATASVTCNVGYKSKYGIIKCLPNHQWEVPECIENGEEISGGAIYFSISNLELMFILFLFIYFVVF